MLKRIRLRDYDFKLVLMVAALAVIGVLAVGSAADEALQARQLAGAVAGLFLMLVISFFNYSWILKFYWVMYGLNAVLLLLVWARGEEHGGAQRWLVVGGLQFQPSETAKILLILFFAQFIMKYKEKINSVRVIGACLLLFAVPLYLVLQQPDLSTSIVLIVLFCVVMFVGGISLKLVFGVMVFVIPAVALLVSLALQPGKDVGILQGFQQERLLVFFNPEEYPDKTLQQQNSVKAIGSGILNGKGYKNNEINSVKNGNFISEDETDFIFAIIGEEFGFKGCLVVILLLFGVSLDCISVARRSQDTAGRIIAAGMGGLVAFQSFINIGVATYILPNTGLPLPFISYGLTSLLSLFMGMGFVLSVGYQSRKNKTKRGY